MKRVLIADDNEGMRRSLVEGLNLFGDELHAIGAENGQEAIGLLEQRDIDLLVTDLAMPVLDGFELLSYVKRRRSSLPFIVVTSRDYPTTVERLETFGAPPVFSKPVKTRELADEIHRLLDQASEGHLSGVTLHSLLQLLEWERKSCSVLITAGDRKGRLHFASGQLVNAYTFDDEIEGEEAAMRILTWEDADLEIGRSYHNHKQLIHRSLQEIMIDAACRVDEARSGIGDATDPTPTAGRVSVELSVDLSAHEAHDSATPPPDPYAPHPDPHPDPQLDLHHDAPHDEEGPYADLSPKAVFSNETDISIPATAVDAWFASMEGASPVKESQATMDGSTVERNLQKKTSALEVALENLMARVQEADRVVGQAIGELSEFKRRRYEYEEAERHYRERQRRLEDLRKGAESLAQQLLSAVKEVDGEEAEALMQAVQEAVDLPDEEVLDLSDMEMSDEDEIGALGH